MVNYEQALSIAKDLLGKVDDYFEYRDYYVFAYDTPVMQDSSSNLVAIEKKTGKAYNYRAREKAPKRQSKIRSRYSTSSACPKFIRLPAWRFLR